MLELKVTLILAFLTWELMLLNSKGLQRFACLYTSFCDLFNYVEFLHLANMEKGWGLLIFLQTVHVDQLTGASTVLFTFILDRGITWEVLVPFNTTQLMRCFTWIKVSLLNIIFLCVSLRATCWMKSKRMGLVQLMMASMSPRGSGWEGVISFWHLKGIILFSVFICYPKFHWILTHGELYLKY